MIDRKRIHAAVDAMLDAREGKMANRGGVSVNSVGGRDHFSDTGIVLIVDDRPLERRPEENKPREMSREAAMVICEAFEHMLDQKGIEYPGVNMDTGIKKWLDKAARADQPSEN